MDAAYEHLLVALGARLKRTAQNHNKIASTVPFEACLEDLNDLLSQRAVGAVLKKNL